MSLDNQGDVAQPEPLETVAQKTFDVAIIGAGINGAASAELLARSGYSVLLVDQNDFGSGATSRSGRVNHCGLRYFDRGEPVWKFLKNPRWFFEQIKRARATMKNRAEMAADFPQHVRATTMVLPIRKKDHAAPWMIRNAFRLLEFIGPSGVPLDARRVPKSDWNSTPYINIMGSTDSLKAVFTFREYQYYWPERLCVDYALSAQSNGAAVYNHVSVDSLSQDAKGGWELTLRGKGQNKTINCSAHTVLNASGAWADRLMGKVRPEAGKMIEATKGTFLVVKLPEDFEGHSVATFDHRGYPFYGLSVPGYHVIGPTEWDNDQDLDAPRSTREDIDQILQNFNTLFPGCQFALKDVCYCWTGIRPMPFHPNNEGKQNLIAELHDHISDGMANLFTLVGGPLMTHRLTAREIAKTLGKTLVSPERVNSPMASGIRFRDAASHDVRKMNSLGDEDIKKLAIEERVGSLSDLLFRRLGSGWYPGMAMEEAPRLAKVLGEAFGWTDERVAAEIEDYKKETEQFECPAPKS